MSDVVPGGFATAASATNGARRPFDDRLHVAEGGRVLEAPWRERPFDVRALFEAERRRRA